MKALLRLGTLGPLAWLIGAAASGACKGGVEHVKDGGPNTAKYCAEAPREEQNCMACASKPGCGWCSNPAQTGSPSCQPGTSDKNQPDTCAVPLIIGNDGCEAPPPPPP